MNLSSLGVSEIWLKFKKHTKEPNKEQSRAAKKKLAMEFNMNIIFPITRTIMLMVAFSRQPIWPMFHSTLHVCGKAYDQTPHNDRFCPLCNSGILEDEFHFLLHCPKYSIPREKFYNQIQHYFVDFNQLSSTELLIKLMNWQNFSLNSHLLKFVSLCNDLRNNLLSNHTDDTWLTIVIIAL